MGNNEEEGKGAPSAADEEEGLTAMGNNEEVRRRKPALRDCGCSVGFALQFDLPYDDEQTV
jgi:hypothetical protein